VGGSRTGPVTVVVSNGTAMSAAQAVPVGAFSPGVFTVAGYAVAINPDGSLAAPGGAIPGIPSHPATPGDPLVLLGSGFGAVTPSAITGDNSLDTLRNAIAVPTVTIGGVCSGHLRRIVAAIRGRVPDQRHHALHRNACQCRDVAIETGGVAGTVQTATAIGAGWPQWAQNPQHTSALGVAGQSLNEILENIIFDPLVPAGTTVQLQRTGGALSGSAGRWERSCTWSISPAATPPAPFPVQIWGENKFTWQNGQLVQQWGYASDWKAPGSSNDFWEPVFHAALGNGVIYLPGASGSVIELNEASGALIQRFAPFGTDPNTYETGPITIDSGGNLYYNVVQVVTTNGFYGNDSTNSWVVKISSGGAVSMASYPALTASQAPGAASQCVTSFDTQLPWPPSTTAVPQASTCGSQRAGLNVSPAVAPDGTIYTVSRAHFNDRYAFLLALNPDLSVKWIASLRNRFHDGCGVSVADGGWLPPNGTPGGCSAGALPGVDPADESARRRQRSGRRVIDAGGGARWYDPVWRLESLQLCPGPPDAFRRQR
jgi:hypothetical protein